MTDFFEKWKMNPAKAKGAQRKDAIRGIDRFDREDMDALAAEMKELRVTRDRLCEKAEMGNHLTSDTVMGFHKVEAQLNDRDDMDPLCDLNWRVQQELMGTTEWERLHTWTEGDLVASGMAFVAVEPELQAILDETKQHDKEKEDWEQKAKEQEEAEAGGSIFEGLIEDFLNGNPTDEEIENVNIIWGQVTDALAQGRADLQAAGQAIDDAIGREVGKHVPALRADMAKQADAEEAAAAQARAWGRDPGELKRLPAKERLRLAERLAKVKDFEKLTALIGMMRHIAETEQTRKVDYLFEEVYDVTIGDDLEHILPSEMLGLLHPAAKLDFYRKFAEKELLQYQMRGEEVVGKGGIIFCKDDSGSMSGQRNMWAVAVSQACLSIAHNQKRPFVGLNFGSRNELMEFDFSTPESYSLDKMIDYAEFFFNGGTDFERPLARALAILQAEHKAEGRISGDIVFCTDGCAGVTPEFMTKFKAEQERLGFRVYGIMIGGNREGEPLWSICDHRVVTIQDLLSGDDVRELFRDL